jgi:hypothetical protein
LDVPDVEGWAWSHFLTPNPRLFKDSSMPKAFACTGGRHRHREIFSTKLNLPRAAVVQSEAFHYAQQQGLYVRTQSGESVVLAEPPRGFKAAEW